MLPNNKNIYLVAVQASKLIKDKKVVVMATRSVPQGIAALLAFDPDGSEKDNTAAMEQALSGITSMSVTHAVRDTVIEGEHIGNGQMLGMVDGAIDCVTDTHEECIGKLTLKMEGASFITVFCGEEVSDEQAETTAQIIRAAVPSAEVVSIKGGQPIYSYIISVER